MKFTLLTICWPTMLLTFALIWLAVGAMRIRAVIKAAESESWGSEKEGGPLTTTGIILVSVYSLVFGAFRPLKDLARKP